MDDLLKLVVVTLLFGGGTLFLLAISPVGKAVAARITGRIGPSLSEDEVEDLRALRHEIEGLQALRGEVSDLAERVDFAERLLTKPRG